MTGQVQVSIDINRAHYCQLWMILIVKIREELISVYKEYMYDLQLLGDHTYP
jgi:hypothetical protein